MSAIKDPNKTLLRCLRSAYRQADYEKRDYVVVHSPPPRHHGGGDVIPYYVPFEEADQYELKHCVVVAWRYPNEDRTQDVLAKVLGCLHRAGKCPEDPVPALRDALKLIAQEIERRDG
jgi:hypothetical protein